MVGAATLEKSMSEQNRFLDFPWTIRGRQCPRQLAQPRLVGGKRHHQARPDAGADDEHFLFGRESIDQRTEFLTQAIDAAAASPLAFMLALKSSTTTMSPERWPMCSSDGSARATMSEGGKNWRMSRRFLRSSQPKRVPSGQLAQHPLPNEHRRGGELQAARFQAMQKQDQRDRPGE